MTKMSPSLERINRQLLGLVTIGVIVSVGLFVGLNQNGYLGPIRDGSDSKQIFKWKISDHNSLNNPLPNNLTDLTAPQYQLDTVIKLERSGNGDLKTLPRFQGELEFRSR